MDELKKCPDCAEMVRAEARICRFCGYRFDARARREGAAGGGLADLLRRPAKLQRTLPEILENWGLELEPGEDAAFFSYCKLERAYGFLLITSDRVAFFSGKGGTRMLDWRLGGLRGVERLEGLVGRGLRLSGPNDAAVTLRRFESRGALDDAARLLANG